MWDERSEPWQAQLHGAEAQCPLLEEERPCCPELPMSANDCRTFSSTLPTTLGRPSGKQNKSGHIVTSAAKTSKANGGANASALSVLLSVAPSAAMLIAKPPLAHDQCHCRGH